MFPKISLCIPTMNRYDEFLSIYIPEYLENPYINEIIICDENGNDKDKIDLKFNNSKLKTFKNNNKLGPFLNKINCVLNATNEWICLIDSDNFADLKYFETLKKYFESNNIDKTTILAPSFAQPKFDYTHLEGICITKNNLKEIIGKEQSLRKKNNQDLLVCMNTGNYFFNKYIFENLDLDKESEYIYNTPSCDVIYINTLFFEQLNIKFIIVPQLYYLHNVHDGSIFNQTCNQYRYYQQKVFNRFFSI
jgi:NDP-sugar pyrophosphorylase family protein